MRSSLAASFCVALATWPCWPAEPRAAQEDGGPLVRSVELDMTINPASAGWVEQALDDAENDGAEIVVFRLDTPGGLDDSTRDIVKDILAAPMPVVVYVSPNGARAGSAGAYITEAADVAAMAPETNIGSATPISLGGGEQDEVLGRKIRNDAAAYIRALAEGHGRNGDLAEQLVRGRRERDRDRSPAAQPHRHRGRGRAGPGARAGRFPGAGPEGADARDHRRPDRLASRCRSSSRRWSCW